MTDLNRVLVRGPASDPHTVDLEWYRHELDRRRPRRLDPLTQLAYQAPAASDDAPGEVAARPHPQTWRTGTIPPTSPARRLRDIVEVWGEDSFPASDPPANW